MRLVESEDDIAKLASLQQTLATLMTRWADIKAAQPPDIDTGKGYKVSSPDLNAWMFDPERGLFWNQQIYPLNQQIEQLQNKIKSEKRVGLLRAKAGSDNGFDTSETLYHGTSAQFDTFDMTKNRTAAHIYTSPDIETARSYGNNVYALYGRQQPQADLSIESENYALVKKVYRRGGFKRYYQLSAEEFSELVFEGELYQHHGNSRLQDEVVSTCLSMRFRSVRITDRTPGGARNAFSDSVIFGNPTDLQIIEQVDDGN
jgi:hypothetical protein